jgi:predicted nucleic acid-binding protein
VVVLGEYRFGIAHSRRRREYEQTIRNFPVWFRVFDVDRETTESYAELRVELKLAGKPIPSNDV